MVQRPRWSDRRWTVPVSSGSATSGARSPTAGSAHGSERSRRLHDEQQAAPDGDRRVGRRADVRQPAGRPDRERLVDERVGQAARRDALDAARRAAGATRGRRAGPAAAARPAAPSGPGARMSTVRDRASRIAAVATGRARASPAGRCWRGRGRSAAAQRADDDQAGPRPRRSAARTASSVSDSSLSGRRPFERHAGRLERAERVLADRVAVADPQVDARPRAPRRAARRRRPR